MSYLPNIIYFILVVATFGFFGKNLLKIWRRFEYGKGKEENRLTNIPRRLTELFSFGFIQQKMFRDPLAGIMHAFIFWGFIIVSLGTAELLISGIFPFMHLGHLLGEDSKVYHAFLWSQDFGNFIVLAAIIFAIVRRLTFPPKRFQGLEKASRVDAMYVLIFIAALVFTSLVLVGSRAQAGLVPASAVPVGNALASMFSFAVTDWVMFDKGMFWVHSFVLFGFTTFLPYSKHQHLIWVWPNIFFRNHHKRGRLRPMIFDENAESFGVHKPEEFTWKQLLDSYTCVECGRCTEVCPANVTGKPLDPRKIMHDIKYSLINHTTTPEAEHRPLIGGSYVTPDELWSCTTCGACMEACPLYIEHIPAIVDMRRYLTMTEGAFPEEAQAVFRNLENNGSPWAFSPANRADWAKDLPVTTMAQKSDVEYLFWVGCAGSYDDRYTGVTKSIAKILNKADISFSILGTEERCNGDTARRLGNEYLADAQIQENIGTMQKYNVKKIVTGCPHCFNTIKNEYPDFGFKAEVIHHSELIADLVKTGRVKSTEVPAESAVQDVTFHDSCYLGRHNQVYEEPRKSLLHVPGVKLTEMPRNKEKGFCCGAGGGRMWLEETIGERVNENRAKEAIATGATTIATACPFCMTMMNDGIKSQGKEATVNVKDIAEIVANSLT